MASIVVLSVLTSLLVLVLAIARGGTPERWVATSAAAIFVIDPIYHLVVGKVDFTGFVLGHFLMDLANFAVTTTVALRANRIWPMFASAALLVGLVCHLFAAFHVQGVNWAFWAMTQLPPWAQLMIILIGTKLHQTRLARVGPYPNWSQSLSRRT